MNSKTNLNTDVIKHKRTLLVPSIKRYSDNGSRAVILYEKKSGECYIDLSTNLSSKLQNSETIFIKQDDSHLEIATDMVKNGFLIETDITEQSGYNKYKAYKITKKLKDMDIGI